MTAVALGRLVRTAVALAGCACFAAAVPAAAQSAESAAPSLEGTWRVQVTQYSCANPSIQFPPFWSLLTFARGGTEIETTSNPALQPGQRTPSHGFWVTVGENTYFSATEAFILFDSPTNPPGLKKGVQKILQSISLTGPNQFSALATVKFFNADGTTTSGCAKAQGTRLTGSADQP